MDTERICTVCGETKNLSLYPKNGVDKDGNVRHRPDCKECYGISRKASKKKHRKFTNSTKHRTGEEKSLSLKDWKQALLHFRGCCAYCGRKGSRSVKMTKDHVVPVSVGGLTVRENIVPACANCNCSKGDRKMADWYKEQSTYTPSKLAHIVDWVGDTNGAGK